MGMAKPMFSTEVPPATFTPTTRPSRVTSGPPELPTFSPHLRAPLLPTVPAVVWVAGAPGVDVAGQGLEDAG
jgi:hypothetical protein